MIVVTLAEKFHKIFKIHSFFIKNSKMIFWSILFKFAKSTDLKIADTIPINSKRELVETRRSIKNLWNYFLPFFADLAR